MKLYYAPGACSLATRISLHEAGLAAKFERVDLKTKATESGANYVAINPKGSVPMLVLDDGQAVTENVAILTLVADLEPVFEPGNPLGRIRLIEMLSYLSTELHAAFRPLWHGGSEVEKLQASYAVAGRLDLLAGQVRELYLFGPRFTVADAYLFVMLRWAIRAGIRPPIELLGYYERVESRPSVRRALKEEGLSVDHPLPQTPLPMAS
ncbi:glutathione S-transferase N-terminal domain-containing protein [Sphingosinicella sp. BN140058]|uniref:glutathione S-transferase N-terminal domain-containing protein n=1 Tax=Sphingosinicella sp. BN140058 TaxID=1892855 RepID=UPI001011CAD3|nr:glutathione S-transferase N-terminal domain-containing protein [Sphingosinicella sp. BN140058]QAY78970.1 glutathione S-transferase [Sphingosinicella sp. BN140058]